MLQTIGETYLPIRVLASSEVSAGGPLDARLNDKTYLPIRVLTSLEECAGEPFDESIQRLSHTYLGRSEDSYG